MQVTTGTVVNGKIELAAISEIERGQYVTAEELLRELPR
jgi:hypothetical protein